MEFEPVQASPVAVKAAHGIRGSKKYSFDFEKLKPGQSFQIPFSYIAYNTLRTMVYRYNTKMGAKLMVLKHMEISFFEVSNPVNVGSDDEQ